MQKNHCANFNHRRTNPPVHFCLDCGEVLNDNISVQNCSEEAHAKKRKERNRYCIDCGKLLREGN